MKLNIPFVVEVKATAKGSSVEDVRRRLNAIAGQPEHDEERQYLMRALEHKQDHG